MNGLADNTYINGRNKIPFTWISIGSSVIDKKVVDSDLADVIAVRKLEY